MPDVDAKASTNEPSGRPLILTDRIDPPLPADNPLPVLLLTDRIDPQSVARLPLWRRRLLAAATVGAIATLLLERPDFHYSRGEHPLFGIFAFTVPPVPLFGGLSGGVVLLLFLILAAFALWPRKR